jgi:biopolymer transport protein ExbB
MFIDMLYAALKGLFSLVGLEQGFINMWEAIRDYLEMGGPVLYLIGAFLVIMWIMIIERIIYFMTRHQEIVKRTIDKWNARPERKSWAAHRIREAMISEVRLSANRYIDLIQACVALCPLMGLLGTVSGMIKVFEVMAQMGTGNARAMASGVSQSTIPTLSGMVAALSGMFISIYLQHKAENEIKILGEHMTMDH